MSVQFSIPSTDMLAIGSLALVLGEIYAQLQTFLFALLVLKLQDAGICLLKNH